MQERLDAILDRGPAGVRWSVCLRDGVSTPAERAADDVLGTASIGKLLLLAEVARRDPSSLDRRVARCDAVPVADSGIWQHLRVDELSVHDLAVLVAATSDNLATNALIAHVGLDAVAACGRDLGLRRTSLLDVVRGFRDDTVPEQLSCGSARELAGFMAAVAAGQLVDASVSARLAGWLALNTDLSMVASAFALDPLAHTARDEPGVRLFNKTGTNSGVRGDVGHVSGAGGSMSYAVLANVIDPALHPHVLATMREVGDLLVDRVG
ncbi:MAG TPA: serine hydrolase [Jatrophihabitans sp.]|jgi:beta-lactamase class A|uniref:serine hydrolase n=1 Tax=Jatrophihabitans sp. TaxID=1932789 RepID=UPI002DFF5BAC|nr:serine hydrolase [Jatrophihabitans sp.]